jgi:long-chain acyl-CoA synthetase
VLQVFVYGDSLQSSLVAVVVPDPEALLPWAAERGIGGDLGVLCANAHVRDAVLKSMQEQAREAQLRGFEQVRSARARRAAPRIM